MTEKEYKKLQLKADQKRDETELLYQINHDENWARFAKLLEFLIKH